MSPFQFFTRRHKQPSESLSHDLRSLLSLHLRFCNLQVLPDSIGWMQSLKCLDLRGNNFVTLPSTINKLSRLAYLNLGECKELQCLPELPLSTNTDFSEGQLAANDDSSIKLSSGLRIFNCPKLAENKIQPYIKLALSWLKKLVQEPLHPKERIDIVIPGNDIPEWFNHQGLGCSKRVQLPLSRDWIGVALCAALVPKGYDNIDHSDLSSYHSTSIMWELCVGKETRRIHIHPAVMREVAAVESDHLWLFYLP